jgi:hypothetical protein
VTFLVEGRFVPRTYFVIVADSIEDARKTLEDYLDTLHKETPNRPTFGFYNSGRKRRRFEHYVEQYRITPLPQEAGVHPLSLWQV